MAFDPPSYSPPGYSTSTSSETNTTSTSNGLLSDLEQLKKKENEHKAQLCGPYGYYDYRQRNSGHGCAVCCAAVVVVIIIVVVSIYTSTSKSSNSSNASSVYNGTSSASQVLSKSTSLIPTSTGINLQNGFGGGKGGDAEYVSRRYAAPSSTRSLTHMITSLSSAERTPSFATSSLTVNQTATSSLGLSMDNGGSYHHLSGGQIAGIVVGVVVFVLIIILGALYLVFPRTLQACMEKRGIFSSKEEKKERKERGKREANKACFSPGMQSLGDSNSQPSVSNTSVADMSSQYSIESNSATNTGPVMTENSRYLTYSADAQNDPTSPSVVLNTPLPLSPIDLEQGDMGTNVWRN